MKIMFFDGYSAATLDISSGISLKWLTVPFIKSGSKIRLVDQDLWDLFPADEIDPINPPKDAPFQKGETYFLEVKGGDDSIVIGLSFGSFIGRDSLLSKYIMNSIDKQNISDPNAFSRIDLDFGDDEGIYEILADPTADRVRKLAQGYREVLYY